MTAAERARRKRRRMLSRIGLLAVLVLAAVWGAVLGIRALAGLFSAKPQGSLPQTPVEQYDSSTYTFNPNDPCLVLVNNNLPLSAEPAAEQLREESAGQEGTTVLLAPAAEGWQAMLQAAAQEGIALTLAADGGYQTAEQRAALYEEASEKARKAGSADAAAVAAAAVGTPEGNEHGTGLALDFAALPKTDFEDTQAYAWLTAHAADYGFILRYPQQGQAITGRAAQPQHWRYVGVENARAIAADGCTLEEFLALQLLAAENENRL